jgi:plasmid replication initiation protein
MRENAVTTIVHHNDLIESSYKLNIDELRLLNLALTKIDSRKENIGIIEIFPNEFSDMFNLEKKNIWRNMKNSLLSIMQKPVKIRFKDEDGKLKERAIAWLGSTTYFVDQSDGAKIELEFTSQISPYLFELHGNFTKLNFEYASRLNTPFSFRLYQWLVREHRTKRGLYYELTMTINDIKRNSQLDNSYPVWMDFKKKIIQPAIDAINQKTNLSVSYSVTKKGKKAHSLTFIYIDEMAKSIKALENGEEVELSNLKPIRPRLLRRPKVLKGSHAEGEWQRSNLKLLSQYQTDLKMWDNSARLTIPDLKKLIDYSRLFATAIHDTAAEELASRQR